jgi:protoporphyrinogen oxidase
LAKIETFPIKTDQNAMQNEPIAILGGGLAGLAASSVTRAPVYEADEQFGGVALTDSRDGYRFDRGIHVLQTRNPRIIKLLDEVGVQFREHDRLAFIHSHGTFTPYPFQVNTAGMPLALRARCVWGYLRRERDRPLRNYEDWMYASIGRGFADTFLIPYSEKFWGVHPREMTYEWTGNRVPHTSTLQVLRGAVWSRQTAVGTNATFRYPVRGGYGAIATALQSRAGPLRGGHRASAVNLAQRTVTFENGRSLRYERLVSTIPLPTLVRLCGDVPADIAQAAASLRSNSIRVVNLGIERAKVSDWHWVHFPGPETCFFRISFPHNFAEDAAPPNRSSISAEVAYKAGERIDDSELAARVTRELVGVGLLRADDRVSHVCSHDIPSAYCIYDFQRKAAIRKLRGWLLGAGVITAGRYGRWTYFWSDESIMSGLHAGEQVLRPVQDAHRDEDDAVAAD